MLFKKIIWANTILIFSNAGPNAVWDSNNRNVDDQHVALCANTDGSVQNPVGCMCTLPQWGELPEITTAPKRYCNHGNSALMLPTVYGVCANTDGSVTMNQPDRGACLCGNEICQLWENVDSYCYAAVNGCLPRCPNGLIPANMHGCICFLPFVQSAQVGQWCDRAGSTIHPICGDPPCVCGAALCAVGNTCNADVCTPIPPPPPVEMKLKSSTPTLYQFKQWNIYIFACFFVVVSFSFSLRARIFLKEERTPLISVI